MLSMKYERYAKYCLASSKRLADTRQLSTTGSLTVISEVMCSIAAPTQVTSRVTDD